MFTQDKNPVDEYSDAIEILSTRSKHFGNLAERMGVTWREFMPMIDEIAYYLPPELRVKFGAVGMSLTNELEELSEAIQMDLYSHIKMINAGAGLMIYQSGEYEKIINDYKDNLIK